MSSATVVLGGQFGSEAKGQVAGTLALDNEYEWAVSNSGSQAGHTYINKDKIVTRHVPIAAAINERTKVYIGPASVLDLDVLMEECFRFHCEDRVYIHRNAAVILPGDHELDQELVARMGSTGKGNGAALANKIMRAAPLIGDYKTNFNMVDGPPWKNTDNIIIEAAQGFDLSIDRQFYPFCTSRNCWVGQALADAWIHPHSVELETVLVFRTYPIRVGGNSGGWHPDQREVEWDTLGVKPEVTTVTGRQRRIATFSEIQFIEACRINKPDVIAMSHMDYLPPEIQPHFEHRLRTLTKSLDLFPTFLWGYGPEAKHWKWDYQE